jgi:hypothetical protein
MKKILPLLLLFVLFTGISFGQDLKAPDLKGFKKVNNYPVFVRENLWDFIDGAADAYLALGFIDLHVTEYKKGKNVIKLEIYHHNDDIMAFGIYSSERSPSFRYLNLGSQGYTTDGTINFFKGSYYVKIRTFSADESTLRALETLAARVSEMIPGSSSMPVALSVFPSEGKKLNEETYINENVLGHKFLEKAFRAEYQAGNDSFSIYLFERESSSSVKSAVNSYLSISGLDQVQNDTGRYLLRDGYNGTVFIAWNEKRFIIISGLSKDQSSIADRYMSEMLR